jgi:hypothetical protein
MKTFRVLLPALALCAVCARAEVEFSDIVRWNLVRKTDALPAETPRAAVSVPSLAVDAKGQSEVMVTLTNDVTVLAPTNAVDGRALKWRFTASGGDRTVTWPTNSFRVPASSTMAYANTVSNGTASVYVTEYHAAKGLWLIQAYVWGY